MENTNASIKVSVSEGLIEVTGSETFVTSQVDNIKEFIKSLSDQPVKTKKSKAGTAESDSEENEEEMEKEQDGGGKEKVKIEKYDAVFAVEDGKVELICDVPGAGASEVTFNAAVLYAWGLKLNSTDEANVSDIREICKATGDFNEANFSSYLKKGSPNFYRDKGKGGARVIKLTKKGEREAKALADKIQNEA